MCREGYRWTPRRVGAMWRAGHTEDDAERLSSLDWGSWNARGHGGIPRTFFFLPEPSSCSLLQQDRAGQGELFLEGNTGSGAAARQGNACCCSSFQPRRIQRGLPREKMNKGPRKQWNRDTAPLLVAGEPVSEPFGPFGRPSNAPSNAPSNSRPSSQTSNLELDGEASFPPPPPVLSAVASARLGPRLKTASYPSHWPLPPLIRPQPSSRSFSPPLHPSSTPVT